ALIDAVQATEKKGVLFVVAAGNDRSNIDTQWGLHTYPASLNTDNMIAVAATNDKDELAFFSNYGKKTVHLAAPGEKVYSTIPGNQYKAYSGTSMACPHVAGAAALVWSKHPSWTYKQVKKALLDSV